MYLLPLVDVEAVVLQLLLQNIWDVDVNMDDLLLTFPLNTDVRFNPLEQKRYQRSGTCYTETKRMWFSVDRSHGHKTETA